MTLDWVYRFRVENANPGSIGLLAVDRIFFSISNCVGIVKIEKIVSVLIIVFVLSPSPYGHDKSFSSTVRFQGDRGSLRKATQPTRKMRQTQP